MKALSQSRTQNYSRQVKASILFKGLAVACSFFSIPLMIHYLGHAEYGVWSTLLSVMTWVTFFDLGLGNGLRNKLAESLAKNQAAEGQRYISSAYSLIGLISLALLLVLVTVAFLLPWQSIFNTRLLSTNILNWTVLTTGFFIIFNFWLSLINAVLNAVQKTSTVVFGQFVCSLVSLVLVYILTKVTDSSLLYLAVVYGISLIGTNILLTLWFFKRKLNLAPGVSLDRKHVRPLLSLGLRFFVIQAAVLIIFTTDKILITQLFGPEYVTQYDVVFKLFSIITMLHSLVTAPLWSSYTDAYHRGDMNWIRSMLRKQMALFILVLISVGTMLIIAKPVIEFWIGKDLVVSMPLVSSLALFVLVSVWNNIYAYLLNGIGKIQFQMYTSVLAMLINIPLAIYLTRHMGFGTNGVVLATTVSLSIFAIVGPIETYVFLRKN